MTNHILYAIALYCCTPANAPCQVLIGCILPHQCLVNILKSSYIYNTYQWQHIIGGENRSSLVHIALLLIIFFMLYPDLLWYGRSWNPICLWVKLLDSSAPLPKRTYSVLTQVSQTKYSLHHLVSRWIHHIQQIWLLTPPVDHPRGGYNVTSPLPVTVDSREVYQGSSVADSWVYWNLVQNFIC